MADAKTTPAATEAPASQQQANAAGQHANATRPKVDPKKDPKMAARLAELEERYMAERREIEASPTPVTEFPAYKYNGETGEAKEVKSKAEADKLGAGWTDTPPVPKDRQQAIEDAKKRGTHDDDIPRPLPTPDTDPKPRGIR